MPDPAAPIHHARAGEGCKWDLQRADAATVAPFALHLRADAWDELAALSRALWRELARGTGTSASG
jgi:hypothetical protein